MASPRCTSQFRAWRVTVRNGGKSFASFIWLAPISRPSPGTRVSRHCILPCSATDPCAWRPCSIAEPISMRRISLVRPPFTVRHFMGSSDSSIFCCGRVPGQIRLTTRATRRSAWPGIADISKSPTAWKSRCTSCSPEQGSRRWRRTEPERSGVQLTSSKISGMLEPQSRAVGNQGLEAAGRCGKSRPCTFRPRLPPAVRSPRSVT